MPDNLEAMNKKNLINTNFNSHDSPIIDFDEITIVIPTLNEEEAISLVLNDVLTQGFENILLVDGHSTDATVEIAKQYKIKVVPQKGEGKTGAIATALEHIHTPYFVLIDGDCTYAAADVENMLMYSNYKEVIGARTIGRENISKLNRFGNWLINKTFNTIFASNLTDVCSGMYLLNTEFAKTIPFKTKGFDVEVEIAAHASYYGTIAETPINFYQRVGIQKLQPLRDGANILSSIIKIGFNLYPSRVLSLFAVLLIFPGLFLLSYPFFISVFSFQLSSILLGLILTVIAIQGVTLFMVDTKIRKYQKSNK